MARELVKRLASEKRATAVATSGQTETTADGSATARSTDRKAPLAPNTLLKPGGSLQQEEAGGASSPLGRRRPWRAGGVTLFTPPEQRCTPRHESEVNLDGLHLFSGVRDALVYDSSTVVVFLVMAPCDVDS